MRLFLLPLIIFIVVGVAEDVYIFRQLRRRHLNTWAIVHAVFSVLFLALIITACALPRRSGSEQVLLAVMWMLYGYLSVYLPKTLFTLFSLSGYLPVLFRRRPVRWPSAVGAGLAVVLFGAMWWGALVTREQLDVREVTVEIENLPASFDGYRIAQFSDAHTGTYGSDNTFLTELVETINSTQPDVIVFTGDLVNRRTAELEPHVPTLARLKAPDGVFSILGNHDYGDYSEWNSPAERDSNNLRLRELESGMGWCLLNDSTAWLRRDNDSIALIGVENISAPPFPCYGSLRRAYPNVADSAVKILLSHNPSHWGDELRQDPDCNIALTLSGHTHAMQIRVAGFSPAKWVYPLWGGLYKAPDGRALYVNIGTGTVGFPARIGATPEITLITLKPKRN